MLKRLGPITFTAIVLMIVGVVLFALTPVLYGNFNFDSDLPGVLVFLIGLALLVAGIIVKAMKKK